MRRSALVLVVGAVVAALATPAGAGPSVPPPTASATFETFDAGEVGGPKGPTLDQPAMKAAWKVVKPGRDATLSVSGDPVLVLDGHADALWTSVPMKVKRRGAIARIEITYSGIQEFPHITGRAHQLISVRFTDAKGRWGPSLPIFEEPLTKELDNGTHSALVPVVYSGPVPMKALQFQVTVADTFSYHARIVQTVHIKV